jgi:hypothetical protein
MNAALPGQRCILSGQCCNLSHLQRCILHDSPAPDSLMQEKEEEEMKG